MAGRPGIAYDDVAKACQKIIDDGERITTAKVIAITGGSASTILKHIRTWHEKQQVDQAVELPEQVIDSIKRGYIELLSAEKEKHHKALTREIDRTRDAISQIVELESQVDELNQENKRLKKDLSDQEKLYEKKLSAADGRLSDALEREKALNKELAEIREQYHASQIQLARVETKNEALEKQLSDQSLKTR